MPQSFASLYYHLVFSTKNREPTISPEIAPRLYDYIGALVRSEGGMVLAVGGIADHVHLLVRLRQDRSLSDVLRVVKANSSKWMHETFPDVRPVWWQAGSGRFSVSRCRIEKVTAYFAKQEDHHRSQTFQDEFRSLLVEDGIEFNEKYL
ncbi:IS200/IS605 family transposase [Frigoriglobus tundricola]|uniref:Transposase n=1 Tax=Frigoriglobus tundricola TaxID=2774151 RepID=A0A6M5Z527_9BACT|nr:IS200/IS605 family transposase [Frigoriglobus tundricola]QJX00907.1 Transposase [Frigoriglobus tundricola]